ncbi:tyrosine-type recombinase/integrase [Prevotella disiens]|uniref:tyrosine-type recombinase/integrase n=1 Tax=Prevotella disiens TaxID=28130 RepID=UPI00288ABD8D|nr:tyrosine-type recombinase/integrase [Prevotella disiens]
MSKKKFASQKQKSTIQEIVGWKTPTFHQASECYVSLSAFDPTIGKFRIKKFMLGRIKNKRTQRAYGEALIKRLIEKLIQGWNPWVEIAQPLEYTLFDDACAKYKEYLSKLYRENNMREISMTSYSSRLHVLQEWKKKEKVNLYYCYQFDHRIIGQFLDYVFIDRNNTLQTKNNYLTWLKTFCKYLLERGYIPNNPTDNFSTIRRRDGLKNRDVIPDKILLGIKNFLLENNKHYLLACYILHYLFVRPKEMSLIKVGDISIKDKVLRLYGDNTKNHNDAIITLPDHVLKLMIELKIFAYPSNYYLFSQNYMPGKEYKSERLFRYYWQHSIRKHLKLTDRYKFYSLKDTGITNMLRANTDILSVRDQARHSSILITDRYTPKDIQNANSLLLNYHGVL